MNILILNWRDPNNPKAGGAEIVTLKHAEKWVEAGNKVVWLAATFKGAKKEEIANGIKIVRKGSAYTVYFFAPFYYFFSGIHFDLVIDEIHGLPLFFTPFYVRKPKLAFIHEVAGDIWDYMYPFPVNKIGKLLERLMLLAYRNVVFVTVSESTRSELLGLGIKKAYVIINGIDMPSATKKINKEKELTLIFVSRIVKMKGIEDVIEALIVIKKKITKARLWIVGDGDQQYITQLKEYIQKNNLKDNVTFFGRVSENHKITLLGKAHVLLHASVKEGWGLVIGEAASQKTPAVVYNVGGLKDSVLHNKTGIIVSSNSPQQLAQATLDLFNNKNKYKTLQENAYKWAKSLDWDKATNKSLSLLTNLNKKN